MKTNTFTKLIFTILATMLATTACAGQAAPAIVAQPAGLQEIAVSISKVANGSPTAEVFMNQAGDIYSMTPNGSGYIFSHWNNSMQNWAGFKMNAENAVYAFKSILNQGYVKVDNLNTLPPEYQTILVKVATFGAKCLTTASSTVMNLSNIAPSAMFGIMLVDENGVPIIIEEYVYPIDAGDS